MQTNSVNHSRILITLKLKTLTVQFTLVVRLMASEIMASLIAKTKKASLCESVWTQLLTIPI